MKIPENYIEFLYWFKKETETAWKNMPKANPNDQVNYDWIIGAKWIGLEENKIEKIERKYNISFTSEHKEFLKILHAIDKKEPKEFYNNNNEIYVKQTPYFYNWLTDDEEIRNRFNWSYQEIFRDVKRGDWLKSWGERPNSEKEMEKIFSDWYNSAPKLIPIFSHRFVVNVPKSPVISVWGTDTIIYGWSMKHYLLNEIGGFIDKLSQAIYDKEDKIWYSEPIKEWKEFKDTEWKENEEKDIPFWGELILNNI